MARTLVLWCPDWPLTAAGVRPDLPAAIVAGEHVTVCTAAARAAGVRIGLRRREAQSRCPHLDMHEADPARDTRAFQPAVTAAQALVPHVEIIRPGLMTLDVRGPARVFGGEQAVATQLASAVDQAVGHHDKTDAADHTSYTCHLGVADTRFAALLAARQAGATSTQFMTVPPGEDVTFLAPKPVKTLLQGLSPHDDPAPWRALVRLLQQLGLQTLQDLAALPSVSVADRFGTIGAVAHRWARGHDHQPIVPLETLPDLTVRIEFEEPAQLVDAITFAIRQPAETLITQLQQRGLTCTLLTVEAQSEHAEQLTRRWRTGGFTPSLVVDRVRWQLDGWLSGSAGVAAPTAGIVLIRLDPAEIIEGGSQHSLLDRAAPTAAITQAVTRLQGLLGPDAVLAGVPHGGRDPARWVQAVPWDESDPAVGAGTSRTAPQHQSLPWPGQLPAPAPATVLFDALPAELVDADGRAVTVSGRSVVSAPPAQLRIGAAAHNPAANTAPNTAADTAPNTAADTAANIGTGTNHRRASADPRGHGSWESITGWAGPWPADERWWEPTGRRRARFQVTTASGVAYLLAIQHGGWRVEAIYD